MWGNMEIHHPEIGGGWLNVGGYRQCVICEGLTIFADIEAEILVYLAQMRTKHAPLAAGNSRR